MKTTSLVTVKAPPSRFATARDEAQQRATFETAQLHIKRAINEANRAASLFGTAAGLPKDREATRAKAMESLEDAAAILGDVRRDLHGG